MRDLEVTLICRAKEKINYEDNTFSEHNYYGIKPTKVFDSDAERSEGYQFTCKKKIQPEEISDIGSIGREIESFGINIETRHFSLTKPKFRVLIIPVLISFTITFLTVYHTLSIPDCNPDIDKECSILLHHLTNSFIPSAVNGLLVFAATFYRKLDFL